MAAAAIVVLAVLSCCLSLSLSSLDDSMTIRRPLDQFVRHYEHIHYDKDNLMHHHYRVRKSIGDKPIKLSFIAFDRQFDLSLYPDNQFFHKSATFYDSNGELSKSHSQSYLYIGHDMNNPSVKVLGSLAFGVFDGKMTDNDEVYYIEPSDRYLNESVAESHSIIYRISDIDTSKLFRDHPEATTCGATTRTQQRTLASLIQSNEFDMKRTNSGATRLHKRQASFDATLVRCPLNVIADYKFYNALTSGGDTTLRIAQATSLIRTFVSDGNDNFERQDFDGDGIPDGIQFSIFNLTIETTPPQSPSPFANDFLGAAAYLDEHSNQDWSDFCLSYRFTYRDFAQGVLGLAFVASTGARGGICDSVDSNSDTFNTGIVTLVNYDRRVANAVAGLTFTHEIGHNFGSQHDPADDPRDCQPSDSNGGKYVMFASANDGSRTNNANFSPCSREMMLTQIRNRGQNSGGCFTTAEDSCGNNILDDGEACDCGLNFNTTTMLCYDDPCCNGTSCTLATAVDCSPVQGDCCYSNCTFVEDDILCRLEEDCALAQTCNGTSAVCPPSEARISNESSILMCTDGNNMTRFCLNGTCEGSICIPLGLDDCECTEEEKQCHVCCVLATGVCESTITIAETNTTASQLIPGGVGQVLAVGFPCNNFNGYCNFFNSCQLIDTEGALRRISDVFLNNAVVQTVVDFIQQYWWAPIVGAVVVIVALFLLVLGCHFILPRPKHMKKRANRRKSIRQSRRGRNRVNNPGGYSGYPQSDLVPMRDYDQW